MLKIKADKIKEAKDIKPLWKRLLIKHVYFKFMENQNIMF